MQMFLLSQFIQEAPHLEGSHWTRLKPTMLNYYAQKLHPALLCLVNLKEDLSKKFSALLWSRDLEGPGGHEPLMHDYCNVETTTCQTRFQ
jgi:hypothetical protein